MPRKLWFRSKNTYFFESNKQLENEFNISIVSGCFVPKEGNMPIRIANYNN